MVYLPWLNVFKNAVPRVKGMYHYKNLVQLLVHPFFLFAGFTTLQSMCKLFIASPRNMWNFELWLFYIEAVVFNYIFSRKQAISCKRQKFRAEHWESMTAWN